MTKGYVNEALEPVVEIGLKHGDVTALIPAVIDTGFGGYLCLAERYVGQMENLRGQTFVFGVSMDSKW